jgi:hypothetical protein
MVSIADIVHSLLCLTLKFSKSLTNKLLIINNAATVLITIDFFSDDTLDLGENDNSYNGDLSNNGEFTLLCTSTVILVKRRPIV